MRVLVLLLLFVGCREPRKEVKFIDEGPSDEYREAVREGRTNYVR